MIRLPLLTTLLLLLALPTQAARLELADNLTLLASSRARPPLRAHPHAARR